MTDKLPPLSTQIVAPSQNVFPVAHSVPLKDAVQKTEPVEEEPYTIKCICGFSDDDGNTIYCETCDSWQHIECYYPHNIDDALREDFSHSCVDCKPRAMDRQQAVERQRARTRVSVVQESSDKKPKRPPPKSHKKKPKPNELQLNGHAAAADGTKHSSPHDHPHPAKKSKNSHRPSQSISSQAPKRSPSYGTARVATGHPPSPATTPPDLPKDFDLHEFSLGFHSLADDSSVQIVPYNSFANVTVTNTLSDWLRDGDRLRRDVNMEHDDVFQKLPASIDMQNLPVETEQTTKNVSVPGTPGTRDIAWQRLKAVGAIPSNVPLMELNGQIGFQSAYCSDAENRYEEFSSPLPFVLFHPQLPIYIDTRKEGSQARYVRRSCRPNATLETYLSGGTEYHFWLVSDREIAVGEQITIQWDFRFPNDKKARILRLLGLVDEEAGDQPELNVDESEYQQISAWLHSVLSEYGGCACDLGKECAFNRFHRICIAKLQSRPTPAPKKKVRKPKAQHTISPTSTGYATNSRAASEGRLEDVPENDGRSVSGSSRSKPPSRDMTPTGRQGSFDTLGILTEPTDRDKRKVAMVEDSFRRMEQQQPPRKKKRTSDGNTSSGASASGPGPTIKPKLAGRGSVSQTSSLLNGTADRRYVDAGTTRSKSGSPMSAVSPHTGTTLSNHPRSRHGSAPITSRPQSSGSRPLYRDAAVQTDPEPDAWYTPPPPGPKRRVVSLARRLLDNRRLAREHEEKTRRECLDMASGPSPVDVDSSQEQNFPSSPSAQEPDGMAASSSPILNSTDIVMQDAPVDSPTDAKAPTGPSIAGALKIRSPELRVQMPPPTYSSSPAPVISVGTPLSAGGSLLAQSPSAVGFPLTPFPLTPNGNGSANPSPVKKKLSLSDYKNRMKSKPSVSVDPTVIKAAANGDDPISASSDIVKAESPTAD